MSNEIHALPPSEILNHAPDVKKLFISHSSHDDAFVRDLRLALADLGQAGWIDSRELRGGDPLWPEIQQAIEAASAFAVVVSPGALQSSWVGKELKHAIALRDARGKDNYRVIPLSLNGTKLGVLEEFFGQVPKYIPVSSGAGGVEAALNDILVALGLRDPADMPPTPQPKAEPLEELVLELTDFRFQELEGKRCATARARLVYRPPVQGAREVASSQSWRLNAPIGPIEADDLRWYLEQYAIWPSHYFRDRAQKVKDSLIEWGKLLHAEAMPLAYTANVTQAWSRIASHASRRFSVHADATLEAGAAEADVKLAKEAANVLLALPWELLHDGDSFLFQGANPTRVRRCLPNTKVLDIAVVALPIRILLVTARPEDDTCDYLDHRSSALPLVEAMEALPGLVQIQVLDPPTLPAFREELDRARSENKPYHVIHFDGHGGYDKQVGLGGLCFELPEDTGKLEQRRHVTIYTDELGPMLRDYRIPLVFLDACQTAYAEKVSESVASELLKVGVASVVAMSHSVLVETARRFVTAFYKALAGGKRVGDAMLAGQRNLKDDAFRGRSFGADDLHLADWFVPVLFQERDDPQLFTSTPAKQTVDDFKAALTARLGNLPQPPETGFVGRSRELLALQRLLRHERYAVIRGQGGEGKTALAAELARWMVRSQQIRRAVFVSVETHSHADAVLDAIGSQLVHDYSVATFEDQEKALHPIERALREQPTLLVVDNMESVLLPPYLAQETPDTLTKEAARELKGILNLCERLLQAGETRLVFTSREPLPEPFDAARNRREIHQLDRNDAVKLVERVLNATCTDGCGVSDATREEIEQLVEAVHGHARTLTLLAPSLRKMGVEATRQSLVEMMEDMEKKFPGNREKSLFATIELSLRRMSPENLERVRVLGVFHGGVNLDVLRQMMEWGEADVDTLAGELISTGLATRNPDNHLSLHPALCPYLQGRLDSLEREALTPRWMEAMRVSAWNLVLQQNHDAVVAASMTSVELPNLLALLDLFEHKGDAKAIIDLATALHNLFQALGKPQLMIRLGQARDTAAKTFGAIWNHTQFEAVRTQIEQHMACGSFREALDSAKALLKRARAAGSEAYTGADYDTAGACFLLARVLDTTGSSDHAISLLNEARKNFMTITEARTHKAAELMLSVCISEQATCLFNLGRLEESAATYEESIQRSQQQGDNRQIAVCKFQIGSVRLRQHRYSDALATYGEARDQFKLLNEPLAIAQIWHQTGMVYQEAGQPNEAENAYHQALAIKVRIKDVAGQAGTLSQLGILYSRVFHREEDAVTFFRQAVSKYEAIHDVVNESRARSNLSTSLLNLNQFDEARIEIHLSLKCINQVNPAPEPWKPWAILAAIETNVGNHNAAVEAKRKATNYYLTYRHAGGENYDIDGRISLNVTQDLQANGSAQASFHLSQLASGPGLTDYKPFIHTLQAVVEGSRDRTLADAPELDFQMAAEILLLIETLEKPRVGAGS